MSAILPRSHRVVRREGSIFTITENLPYLLPNFTLPARCHDMPDVHAGRVSHDRACPANNPGPLGAHVGSFAWFWPIGQTARHTLWTPVPALQRHLWPHVPSLGGWGS